MVQVMEGGLFLRSGDVWYVFNKICLGTGYVMWKLSGHTNVGELLLCILESGIVW